MPWVVEVGAQQAGLVSEGCMRTQHQSRHGRCNGCSCDAAHRVVDSTAGIPGRVFKLSSGVTDGRVTLLIESSTQRPESRAGCLS